MKNLFLFLLPSLLFLGGCTDPCADVNCLNGGACNDGTCICPDGFTGEYCETADDGCNNACLNGGTCVNGACDCPSGFTGVNCETVVTDPCADVNCGANGTCIDGDCICDAGYEGTNCETVSRDKFIGSYLVAESCGSGNDNYTMSIVVEPSNVTSITIANLYDAGINVVATVDGNTITIPSQTVSGATIVGSGSISGNVLTLNFTITNGTDSDTCTATCTKL